MGVGDHARVVQIARQVIAKEVIVEAKEMDQTKMQNEVAVRVAQELNLQSKSTKLYMTNLGEGQRLEAGLESLELVVEVLEEVLNWNKILVKKVTIFLETVMITVLEKVKRNIAVEEMSWTREKVLRPMVVVEQTPENLRL